MLPRGLAPRDGHAHERLARKPGPAADVDPLTMFDPARREAVLRSMTREALIFALDTEGADDDCHSS
jgi:hypothetical protein